MKRGDFLRAGKIQGLITAVRDDSVVVWDGDRQRVVYHPIITEDMLYSPNGKNEGLPTRDTQA